MRDHHSVRWSQRVGDVKQLRRRAEGLWQFRGDKVWQCDTTRILNEIDKPRSICSRLSYINLNMWSLWFSLQQIRQIIFVFYLLSQCSSHNFISPSPRTTLYLLSNRCAYSDGLAWKLHPCWNMSPSRPAPFHAIGSWKRNAVLEKFHWLKAGFCSVVCDFLLLFWISAQACLNFHYRRLLHLFSLWSSHKYQSDIPARFSLYAEWFEFVVLSKMLINK